MSDETNSAVQGPTHAVTALIYEADASGMENQASRRRGVFRRRASLADRLALVKGHHTNKALHHQQPCPIAQETGDRLAVK